MLPSISRLSKSHTTLITIWHFFPAKYPGRDGLYVNNPKIIRLSEIYLIAAEAELRGNNDGAAAAKYINDIEKNRVTGYTDVATVTIDDVIFEYEKELFAENQIAFAFWRNRQSNMLSYHITISGSILVDCFPIYFFPRLFGSYGNNIYLCSADLEFVMEQKEVIRNIKRVAMQTLPPRSSLLLYGSRARGDAHADSDWDLLILLDKQFLEAADYRVAYPFRELGWEIGEELNPSLYTKKQWNSWTYLPYYKNVERDKIVII